DAGRGDFIPPNQALKTIQELHMIAGMDDELYDLLSPRLTVYGSKGINVNYANKEVLMSLTPAITAERADKIIEGRNDSNRGPFKNEEDFVQFLNGLGIGNNPFREGDQLKVPLLFDTEYNFRVRSTGRAGKSQRDITAIVFDTDRVKDRLREVLAVKEGPT